MPAPARLAVSLPVVAVALAAAAPPLLAQNDRRLAEAERAFRVAHGDDWVVERNRATGTPRAIWGPGLRVSDRRVEAEPTARVLASRVLDDHRELLGFGTSRFVDDIGARVGDLWVFVLRQRYRDLPVVGGRADVRLHATGVVSMFGAVAVPIAADFDVRPVVTAAFADGVARASLGLPIADPLVNAVARRADPRLVIWAETTGTTPATPRLAFEVRIDDADRERVGRCFVDARTGERIQWIDELLRCRPKAAEADTPAAPTPATRRLKRALALRQLANASSSTTLTGDVHAWVTLGLDPTVIPTRVAMPRVRVRVQGDPGIYHTDARGQFTIPYTGPSPVAVTVDLDDAVHVARVEPRNGTRLTRTRMARPGTPVHFQLSGPNAGEYDRAQVDGYYHTDRVNEYLRTVLVPNPVELDRLDGIALRVNDTTGSCNAFYGGLLMTFYAAGGAPPFVCNTATIADVVAHEWGHGLDDMFGGIRGNTGRDGLSEAWADIVAMYMDDADTLLAGMNPTIARSGVNFVRYPGRGCAGLSPHCAGQSFGGFAWQVREHLARTMSRSAALAISERIVLGAIVADSATQPDAVLEVFLLDDDDGNLLNGTPHGTALAAAADRHEIPYPSTHGSIAHTTLRTYPYRWTPRRVTATVRSLASPLDHVELRYTRLPSGPPTDFTRPMLPTGNPDEYVALLPGAQRTDGVDYHIVAHFGGHEVRTAPTRYFVVQNNPPPVELRIDPAQIAIGSAFGLDVDGGEPNRPLALVIGGTEGPTTIPGGPMLRVGGTLAVLPVLLDAQGALRTTLRAPADPALRNRMFHLQAVTTDAGSNLTASNHSRVLLQ